MGADRRDCTDHGAVGRSSRGCQLLPALGFDVEAIRDALEDGGSRGASTITQQVVKNVFLWQGRSWVRKALETSMIPVVEIVWSKQRILEVYLNVAETGQGIFGVEAAAQKYYGVSAAKMSPTQAARVAAILPSPRNRSVTDPSVRTRRRAGFGSRR